MRLQLISAALVVLTAASAGAQQPPPGIRIAGTVKSVGTACLVLATPKGEVDITLTPQTRVLVRQPATAGEIKQGTYLGTANQNGSKPGLGTAKEIHMMDRGPNVNFALNKSGLMMTNGTVESVTHTPTGDELDIDYGQTQTRHVIVGKDTVMARMVDVGVAGLKPGLEVSASATTGSGGKPTATFISVTTKPNP